MSLPIGKIQEVMQEAAPLPEPVWLVVKGLSRIHWFWHWNRKRELYQDPDNWMGLWAGHLANQVISSGVIRGGAHLLLIVTRIREHVEQVRLFSEEWSRLSDAIRGRFIPLDKGYSEQFRRIRVCMGRVMASLFELTMHTVEVYDSLYRTDEAMNEVVINGIKWMESLSQNRKRLIAGLREMEGLGNRVLKRWEVNFSLETIVDKIERGIYGVEWALEGYRRVDEALGFSALGRAILRPFGLLRAS